MQVFGLRVGVRRLNRLGCRAVALGNFPEGIARRDAVHGRARIPGQQRAVGVPPGNPVDKQPHLSLKLPQRAVGLRAEDPVGLELPIACPVQRELHELHSRSQAPHTQ